jgi:hypothetical protein
MRRLLGAAIVVICIGVPLVESFDTWDHTAQDGNDTEANVVVAALCVGLALSAAATIVISRIRAIAIDRRSRLTLPASFARFDALYLTVPLARSNPPPTALRI